MIVVNLINFLLMFRTQMFVDYYLRENDAVMRHKRITKLDASDERRMNTLL